MESPVLCARADFLQKSRRLFAAERFIVCHQIRRVLGKGENEVIGLRVTKQPIQKPSCLRAVSEHLVSARGLKADMQRDERIVKLIAHREQRLAPSITRAYSPCASST